MSFITEAGSSLKLNVSSSTPNYVTVEVENIGVDLPAYYVSSDNRTYSIKGSRANATPGWRRITPPDYVRTNPQVLAAVVKAQIPVGNGVATSVSRIIVPIPGVTNPVRIDHSSEQVPAIIESPIQIQSGQQSGVSIGTLALGATALIALGFIFFGKPKKQESMEGVVVVR